MPSLGVVFEVRKSLANHDLSSPTGGRRVRNRMRPDWGMNGCYRIANDTFVKSFADIDI